MLGLSERQLQLLCFVYDQIVEHDRRPSMREIGSHMGIRSTNGIMCHFKLLERKGYLEREPNRARCLRLTAKGYSAVEASRRAEVAEQVPEGAKRVLDRPTLTGFYAEHLGNGVPDYLQNVEEGSHE